MNWATFAIERLRNGETVTLKPHGNSMTGRINDGDTVIVKPVDKEPEVDDIVLVKCRGSVYLHLVKARQADRYLIGNNHGYLNGWVNRNAIYGIGIAVYK